MDQGWAAVVAAIAAGVFGITGVLLGIIVGRRQTTDQATVEHGHWLREQRLEAYMAFLTAWDTALRDLSTFQNGWNEQVEQLQESGFDIHPSVMVRGEVNACRERLRPLLERVELLGPDSVKAAVGPLFNAWWTMREVLEEQGAEAPFPTLWQRWEQSLAEAKEARLGFHRAVSRVLRTPPSPRGELLL